MALRHQPRGRRCPQTPLDRTPGGWDSSPSSPPSVACCGDRDPVDAVLDEIPDHSVDRLVIGIKRRTPVGKVLLGSVSQRLLLDSPVPVVAVKLNKCKPLIGERALASGRPAQQPDRDQTSRIVTTEAKNRRKNSAKPRPSPEASRGKSEAQLEVPARHPLHCCPLRAKPSAAPTAQRAVESSTAAASQRVTLGKAATCAT